MIDPTYYIKKITNQEEAKAKQQERKRIEQERNDEIIGIVDRYGVVTPEIVCGVMGINPSPHTAHERTQVRIIHRRLDHLAAHGRFHQQFEYAVLQHGKDVPKSRIRTGAGRAFYLSLALPKKAGMQWEHKAMIARTRATIEHAIALDEQRTDSELREAGGPLIFDWYFRVGDQGFCVECNRSDTPADIGTKCRAWDRQRDHLERVFGVAALRYLWIATTERKARHICDRWTKDNLNTWHFLVTYERDFTPYTPSSILAPIFSCPTDMSLHAFMEED